MTNPDISNPINLTQKSYCFGNHDSISTYPFELDQNQSFENRIDNSARYHFPEIELERECEPESQFDNSIALLESMFTLVFLPDLNHIPEPILNHILVNPKIESPIYQHHISLMRRGEPRFFWFGSNF